MIHIQFYYSNTDNFECKLEPNKLHNFIMAEKGYFYNTTGPISQEEFINLIKPVHSLIGNEIQDLNNKEA